MGNVGFLRADLQKSASSVGSPLVHHSRSVVQVFAPSFICFHVLRGPALHPCLWGGCWILLAGMKDSPAAGEGPAVRVRRFGLCTDKRLWTLGFLLRGLGHH